MAILEHIPLNLIPALIGSLFVLFYLVYMKWVKREPHLSSAALIYFSVITAKAWVYIATKNMDQFMQEDISTIAFGFIAITWVSVSSIKETLSRNK